MANSWFRFKKFMINQDRCAMKVGTDGVILGALAGIPEAAALPSILDVGTGTGLVALMLAQRSTARVDAVEIVAEAASQAAENAAGSPWADRVRVMHADFMEFYPSSSKKYDLIVSNPPYFLNSLKPATNERTLARHGSSEFYRQLLKGCARLLQPSGRCCLILPSGVALYVLELAEAQELYLRERIRIRSKAGEKPVRELLTLGRDVPAEIIEKELIIYEGTGRYTAAFTAIAAPFYLNL